MINDNANKTVLETVKYYKPSKGGMESVVESIVDGISSKSDKYRFIVYSNTHNSTVMSKKCEDNNGNIIFKEATPFVFRSQPMNILYSSLNKLIDECDIIHHHYPFPNMEVALLRNIRVIKNKKLIITWHANVQNSRWSGIAKYYDPIIEKLLELASCIVVTSPQLLDNSLLLKKFCQKVKVIPLSYDSKLSTQGQMPRTISKEAVKKLLFVGKLRKYKGVAFLIDALRGMKNVELTIVGEGEEEPALRKQIESNNMVDSVRFLKNIDNESLQNIYQEADLFVLPSINEAEAFGVVQLEAMANGLPVINTKLNSGVPFVSLDNVTGFTVPPGDSAALRSAISIILNDIELYKTFSANSLERIMLFSTDKLVNSYIDVYESNCV